jgi:hypothetical protein
MFELLRQKFEASSTAAAANDIDIVFRKKILLKGPCQKPASQKVKNQDEDEKSNMHSHCHESPL